MKPVVSIIIPTFNNPQQLNDGVQSILRTGFLNSGLGELIIVNNGKQNCKQTFALHKDEIKVIDCPDNLGWEGGLKEGLKHTEAPFVCFQNDDTHIPFVAQGAFYQNMLTLFRDDKVGAVGPATTTCAGIQSVFNPRTPSNVSEVNWLIFFCVMVRRSALEAVGGIDNTLPGGDDFDLSIRLRKAGYKILFDPEAFIIHHGFQTGTRVHGGPEKSGGWNSPQMTERTNQALIRKHGFKTFFDAIAHQFVEISGEMAPDIEGPMIRSEFNWETDKVLDIACGFQKTHASAIGVDRVSNGDVVPLFYASKESSASDVTADVTKPLPFPDESVDGVIARHIIEHIPDAIGAVRNWMKPLKVGGKLVIATPDDKVCNGIPLSADHVHSFNQEAVKNIGEACGLRHLKSVDTKNGISFYSVFEKLPAETLDRSYEGDCSTHPLGPKLVRVDSYGGTHQC